ncbi:MAG: phage major capsid protein [Magnetococcales bacterium]|nr:phage major capsid protein [Magnetococcales bacterium]
MAGQVWSVSADGGYMYADNLSNKLRFVLQPLSKFRQFCDIKEAMGKNRGDTFHWNVYGDVTAQGGTLVETSTMPETKFTIAQGTLTINEYGNSVPFTEKLDNLSEHPVNEVINQVLKHDANRTLDAAAHLQFAATPLRVTSGTSTSTVTLTTNGTATETNNVALGKGHVQMIVDLMKERSIPAYDGGDYYALGRPATFRQLKQDLEAISHYVETGFKKIMNGEIGRYEGIRFIEQNGIAKGVGSTANTTWSHGNDTVYFLGRDTVAEAVGTPEEIRGKIPGDFGRDRGIAWYYLGGFGICHTQASQARILMWDSAA